MARRSPPADNPFHSPIFWGVLLGGIGVAAVAIAAARNAAESGEWFRCYRCDRAVRHGDEKCWNCDAPFEWR